MMITLLDVENGLPAATNFSFSKVMQSFVQLSAQNNLQHSKTWTVQRPPTRTQNFIVILRIFFFMILRISGNQQFAPVVCKHYSLMFPFSCQRKRKQINKRTHKLTKCTGWVHFFSRILLLMVTWLWILPALTGKWWLYTTETLCMTYIRYHQIVFNKAIELIGEEQVNDSTVIVFFFF